MATTTDAHAGLEEQLLRTAEVGLDLPHGSLSADTQLAEIPGVDSVKLLRLLAEVEETFDVMIDDDIVFEIRCIRDLASTLARTS